MVIIKGKKAHKVSFVDEHATKTKMPLVQTHLVRSFKQENILDPDNSEYVPYDSEWEKEPE